MDERSDELGGPGTPTQAAVADAPLGPITKIADEHVPGAAVRGIAWLGIERVVDQFLALVVFVVLGRLLDPKAFGLMAAATVVVLFLRVLVNAGFSRALVQRETLSEEHIDAAFWSSVGIGAVLALLTVLVAPVLAALFGEPGLTPVIRVLSLIFVLAALDSTPSALADRNMQFGVQATRRFVATIVSSVVAIALAFAGAGVWTLVAQMLSLEATLVVLLWTLTSWRPRMRFSRRHFGDIFAFGTNYLGIRVLFYLSQNADNFLIAAVLGPIALGFYVIAYRVLFVFTELVTLAINQVALPTFSRYQSDSARLHESFYSATTMGAVAGWPVFVGLGLVADRLIPFVFGAKWHDSVPVMEALAGTGVVLVAWTFMQNLVVAVGKVGNEFRWNVFATGAQVTAFAVTAHLGIEAVAIGLTITMAVLWPIRVVWVARLTGIHTAEYWRRLVGPLLATVAMAAVVLIVEQVVSGASDAAALAAEIGAGALTYLIALPLLAPRAFAQLKGALKLLRG